MLFELEHLDSYDNEALLNELRRVAMLVPDQKLTQSIFNKYAKVHSSTIQKRFSGWVNALNSAGLRDQIDGGPVKLTSEELFQAVQT